MTIEEKIAFADLLEATGEGHLVVPVAEAFVSHVWKYCLLDTLKALRASMERQGREDMFIWFDGFIVNQHTAPSRPFTWWSNEFHDAIKGYIFLCFSFLFFF